MRGAVNELMMDENISGISPAANSVDFICPLKTLHDAAAFMLVTENAPSPDFNLNEELY